MKQSKALNTAATFSCLGFILCWTVGPVYIKLLSGLVDAWTQNVLRYGVACLFWLPFFIWTRWTKECQKGVFTRGMVPSLFNILGQTCWAASFYFADPAFIVLLSKTVVFWTALFSMLVFADERKLLKSPAFWSGLVLSVVGVAGVLVFHPDFSFETTGVGFLLATAASLMWAAYTVSVRRVFGQTDSRLSFSIITIYTVLGLGILSFLFGNPGESVHLGAKAWSYVIISGISAIALGHVFYYVAMRRIGATIPSMVTLLTPFTILLISGIRFGERLTMFQWIFGLILIVGTGFAILAQRDFVIESPLPSLAEPQD